MENIFKTYDFEPKIFNNTEKNKYVTMAFVPMQEWEELYDEETALRVGTAFPSLDKPFRGGGR